MSLVIITADGIETTDGVGIVCYPPDHHHSETGNHGKDRQ